MPVAPPFPHLIVGSRPAAAMLDDSANCHAAKHAQTSKMPTPPYHHRVVQRAPMTWCIFFGTFSIQQPSTRHHPYISTAPFRSVEKPGGGVVAFDDKMRNDAYNYGTSLSATDLVGIGGLRLSGICVRVTKTSILAQSLNLFRTTMRPAI